MSPSFSRRQLLQKSLAAGTLASGFFVSPLPAVEPISPQEKLNLGIVGCGNKGWHNVQQLADQNIVAVCDVDTNFLNRAAQVYPASLRYRDYRRMLDAEHHRIDAVVVSTPDHTHAPATAAALELGKHVYCEKPLTHTVAEARVVAQLAANNRLATQMGIQIHAGENYRRVVEWIKSGVIGTVSEVYCWCNKGWGDGRFQSGDRPVPPNLDWNLWLGPAPMRPYSPNVHPANWRRFWDYGSGTFGDMACHVVDLPFWALDLRHPTSAVCEGSPLHPDGAPSWVKATYEFRVNGQPLKLHWSDGGAHFDRVNDTRLSNGQSLSKWGLGILFVGSKGMLAADYGRRLLLPEEQFADFTPPDPFIPASMGHWKEWVQACKTGSPTTCNFNYSGALTETVLLGVVAYRTGKPLVWDAEQMRATNAPEADAYIHKRYRPGWEVPGA